MAKEKAPADAAEEAAVKHEKELAALRHKAMGSPGDPPPAEPAPLVNQKIPNAMGV